MKSRPILFSGPMMRAILCSLRAVPKTKTRRVVKYIPALGEPTEWCHRYLSHSLREIIGDASLYCPYGVPGDLLWCRETWAVGVTFDKTAPRDLPHDTKVWYLADGPKPLGYGKTRVSIHMPRWASRISLEITDVRVERLNDISEEDAEAEGADRGVKCADFAGKIKAATRCAELSIGGLGNHRLGFAWLWESLNGPGSWDRNEWVWVLNFRCCEDPEGL
jgi:hypothetical protein